MLSDGPDHHPSSIIHHPSSIIHPSTVEWTKEGEGGRGEGGKGEEAANTKKWVVRWTKEGNKDDDGMV
jgi:hypothetical protein